MPKVARARRPSKQQTAFNRSSVQMKVALALPLARTVIHGGFGFDPYPQLNRVVACVEYLTGYEDPDDEREAEKAWDKLDAAYALGIAVGSLLRPEALGAGSDLSGDERFAPAPMEGK